jgi:curved DNA-binding protein
MMRSVRSGSNINALAGSPAADWNQWTTQTQAYDVNDLNDLFGDGAFSIAHLWRRRKRAAREASTANPDARARLRTTVEIPLRDAFSGATLTLQKDGQMLVVKVPAGVKTGSKIRMVGQGEAGRQGGAAGDLYLVVKVQPDPHFERDGDDLKTEAPVDVYTLILGGEAMVKTLGGQVSMKVPPETQPGRIIRLRGQGMPNLREPQQRGDLYVKVQAKLPQHLSAEEKKLFEQLAKLRK